MNKAPLGLYLIYHQMWYVNKPPPSAVSPQASPLPGALLTQDIPQASLPGQLGSLSLCGRACSSLQGDTTGSSFLPCSPVELFPQEIPLCVLGSCFIILINELTVIPLTIHRWILILLSQAGAGPGLSEGVGPESQETCRSDSQRSAPTA